MVTWQSHLDGIHKSLNVVDKRRHRTILQYYAHTKWLAGWADSCMAVGYVGRVTKPNRTLRRRLVLSPPTLSLLFHPEAMPDPVIWQFNENHSNSET